MSIGAGVFLFVVGAILRFALTVQVAWFDFPLVGNILMGAGIVVFVLGFILTFRRRRSVSRRCTMVGQEDGGSTVRRTTSTDDTGP